MNPSTYVPSFYMYKLADALSGPYTSLSAYSAGVIDDKGNITKPESSIDAFDYLVIKLKKIIDQLPYGMTKAQLGNYLSTIQYFSERFEHFDITKGQFNFMIEGFICQASENKISYLELLEDMSVGGGGGAPGSLGTPIENSQGSGVAGYDPKLGLPMQRRKKPKYFDNCEVFEVCPDEFVQFKAAKQWKDIPEGENKNYIQRFQRRNKKMKIAVKSLNPLNGENEMHWITYPSPNFLGEDFDPSNAARDIVNAAVKDVIKPPEVDKTSTGRMKTGARTQRAGFLFSTVADLLKGGKKHHENTADTLQRYVSQDVTVPGIDTMVYDETKGLFVPGDLKADTTTPKHSLTDADIEKLPRLPPTLERLRDRMKKGPLSRTEKSSARDEVSRIGQENMKTIKPMFGASLLHLSPNLQWAITPGKSDKPYHYGGLVTRVPSETIKQYARNFDPSLGLRIGKKRVEVVARGKEPSVSDVAQNFSNAGFNTSKDEIVGALEKLVSPTIQRKLMRQLNDLLRRID